MKFLPLPWLLYLTIHCKATDRPLTFVATRQGLISRRSNYFQLWLCSVNLIVGNQETSLCVGAFPRSFLRARMIDWYTVVVVAHSSRSCAPSHHHQHIWTYTYHRIRQKMISEMRLYVLCLYLKPYILSHLADTYTSFFQCVEHHSTYSIYLDLALS